MSMPQRCPRCGHDFDRLSNLKTHLKRKSVCTDVLKCNKFPDEILSILENDTTYCRNIPRLSMEDIFRLYEQNNQYVQLKSNVLQLYKKIEEENRRLNIENAKLQQQICSNIPSSSTGSTHVNLIGNGNNNISTNNTITNNHHVHNNNIVLNFGSEDVSHVVNDKEFLNKCMLAIERGLTDVVERIYYDNEKPENKTVRLKSSKRNTVMVHNDNEWVVKSLNDVVPQMLTKGKNVLYNHCQSQPAPEDDMRMAAMQRKECYLAAIDARKTPEIHKAITSVKSVMENHR